jgi:tetratricopeptide (TPR) repeat protein
MQEPALIQIGSLGKGTSGQVLHAKLLAPLGDYEAGTEVAQKRPLTAAGERSIQREQLVLAGVQAPNLQVSLGLFEDQEGPFLLTRFIDGPTIADLIAQGPMEDEPLRRVGRDLAQALAALHTAGWLHGDLAPANGRQDPGARTILLDLGFAERTDAKASPRGTPAYLSPEEARAAPKTCASEIYSLGLILWELATSSHPLSPDGRASNVPEQALTDAVHLLPSARNPRLAPDLDELLGQMLDEEPSARPNAQEVARWLGNPPPPHAWGEDPWAARDCLPFVGHREERAQLGQAWESASAGQGTLVWLEAERGLGKTRLMEEFVRSLRRGPSPATYLAVRCAAALEGRPTHPIRSLLRRWLALGRHTPASPRESRLLASRTTPQVAAALAQTLDPGADALPQMEVTLLSHWLIRTAGSSPMVILVDELQHAGEATLAVLSRLIDVLPGLPLLLVLGIRSPENSQSEAIAALAARARGSLPQRRMHLSPLDKQSIKELINLTFAGSVPAERLAEALQKRTAGRPTRIDALIKQALLIGLMRVHAGGGLELVGDIEDLPHMQGRIPDLQARLTSMDPEARNWIERIAVDGSVARTERLSQGATRDEVRAAIALLLREDWLEQGPEGPAFASSTIRDGVLTAIPHARRRKLHSQAADALAHESGSGRAFERAFHLKAADRKEELLQLVLELLPKAQALGHPARVLVLVEWALEGSPPPHQEALQISAHQALELHAAAAEAAGGLGRRQQESQHLDALVELPFDSKRNPAEVARVYLLHGHAAADTGRAGLARGYLRNAARLGLPGKQADLTAEALRRLAEIELATGNQEKALKLARRARSRAHSPLVGLKALLIKGLIALLQDRPTRARAHALAILKRCDKTPDTPARAEVEARALILKARCHSAMGDPETALPLLQSALQAAEQAGQRALEAEAHARLGRVLIDLDQDQAAEQSLREGQLIAQEIGTGQGEVLARLFLGTLLMEQDRGLGARLVKQALERACALGLVRAESLAQAIWARVLRTGDHPKEAAEAARAALNSLQRVGAELCDRIVIVGTHQLIIDPEGTGDESRKRSRDLEQRIARVSRAASRGANRARMKASLESLKRAVENPEGPLYPRRGGQSGD